jgi:hypothetical protein
MGKPGFVHGAAGVIGREVYLFWDRENPFAWRII